MSTDMNEVEKTYMHIKEFAFSKKLKFNNFFYSVQILFIESAILAKISKPNLLANVSEMYEILSEEVEND